MHIRLYSTTKLHKISALLTFQVAPVNENALSLLQSVCCGLQALYLGPSLALSNRVLDNNKHPNKILSHLLDFRLKNMIFNM
jgi:hypothetical protein